MFADTAITMEQTTERIPAAYPCGPHPVDTGGRWIMLIAFALMCVGAVAVYSASVSLGQKGVWYARSELRHFVFLAVAMAVLVATSRMDYRMFARGTRMNWPALALLVFSVFLCGLVFVPGVGHEVGGRYRWLRFGPPQYSFGLQPSELIKFTLIIFLSAWLSRRTTNARSPLVFLAAFVLVAGCTGLVITEDLGMGLIICTAGLVTMYIAGIRWYYLVSLLPSGAVAAFVTVVNSPGKLQRITAVIDPWNASNPASYQARQAIVSICSGGVSGRGPGMGIRKLGFLPEDVTDFIFAAFCEEWGLIGASLLVGLLALWVWNTRRVSRGAGDRFGSVLAASLGLVIALQAVLHVAVNLVILPPTGISLPFVSAGGTSLIVTSFAAGLIVSVSSRSGVSDAPMTPGVCKEDARNE